MIQELTAATNKSEFERGTVDGLGLADSGRPLPQLRGGAYGVGVLFGYRASIRSRGPGIISWLRSAQA
jgi:hypothetical protein